MPNPPSATAADDETPPGERNAERPLTRRRTGRRRHSRAPPPHNTLALAHAHDPSAAPATDISIIVLGEIFWVGACALPPPPTPNRFGCPRRADEAVRPFASPPIFNAPRTEHGRRPRAAGAHHFFFFSCTPLPFFFYRNPLVHTHTHPSSTWPAAAAAALVPGRAAPQPAILSVKLSLPPPQHTVVRFSRTPLTSVVGAAKNIVTTFARGFRFFVIASTNLLVFVKLIINFV